VSLSIQVAKLPIQRTTANTHLMEDANLISRSFNPTCSALDFPMMACHVFVNLLVPSTFHPPPSVTSPSNTALPNRSPPPSPPTLALMWMPRLSSVRRYIFFPLRPLTLLPFSLQLLCLLACTYLPFDSLSSEVLLLTTSQRSSVVSVLFSLISETSLR
jgi:hypothetical protein